VRDDAVAPVIAVMLILAAIVTVLSIWNAVYIPSMKQSSEAGHLQNVESAFLHFSSAIERAASARQELALSEPVQLGGGDCLFNTLKSAGSLSVENEPAPVYHLAFYDASAISMREMNGTMAKISYQPIGNFWQDQGYRWQYGYINVTKYRTRQSPLGYYTMTDVQNETNGEGPLASFARSFAGAEYTINQSTLPGNCSRIVVTAVNLSASPGHPFTSGNGFASLKLKAVVNTTAIPGVAVIAFSSDLQPFGNRTLDPFDTGFAQAAGTCRGNIGYPGAIDDIHYLTIRQEVSPVTVTLKTVEIEIGAY
jgi:hypothetical protein